MSANSFVAKRKLVVTEVGGGSLEASCIAADEHHRATMSVPSMGLPSLPLRRCRRRHPRLGRLLPFDRAQLLEAQQVGRSCCGAEIVLGWRIVIKGWRNIKG